MNCKLIILSFCLFLTFLSIPRAQTPDISSDPIITLEWLTDAFAVSPAYKLSIYADGTVLYEGKMNVKTKGIVKSKITRQKLKQLIAEFNRANYFALNDRYAKTEDGCLIIATDQVTAITSLNLGGKKKLVEHYHGCWEKAPPGPIVIFPKELYKLEEKIDKAVNSRRWVE